MQSVACNTNPPHKILSSMKLKTAIYLILSWTILSYRPSNKIKNKPAKVIAYIQKIGVDSISKQKLLIDNEIHFTKSGLRITMAVAYFDQGSFKNVQQQTFTGNKLGFFNSLNWVTNAKTPYRITISDIRYVDNTGNKGLAEEFSFIVY
jgi:hypothetical protein